MIASPLLYFFFDDLNFVKSSLFEMPHFIWMAIAIGLLYHAKMALDWFYLLEFVLFPVGVEKENFQLVFALQTALSNVITMTIIGIFKTFFFTLDQNIQMVPFCIFSFIAGCLLILGFQSDQQLKEKISFEIGDDSPFE